VGRLPGVGVGDAEGSEDPLGELGELLDRVGPRILRAGCGHGGLRRVIRSGQASLGTSRSTIVLPMLSEAVAAGEGALLTLMTRSVSWIRKSSTIDPSGATACARMPAGAGCRCSALISGTSRCSALTNAALLAERHISPSPVFQYFAASL